MKKICAFGIALFIISAANFAYAEGSCSRLTNSFAEMEDRAIVSRANFYNRGRNSGYGDIEVYVNGVKKSEAMIFYNEILLINSKPLDVF